MERTLASLLLAVAVATVARPGAADEPAKEAAQPPEDVEADAGAKRPAAHDDRKGHILFGASGTALGPAGSMGPATASTQLAPVGYGFGGFVGVGLGRHATLQAFGDRTLFISPGACPSNCGGRAFSVGLGFTYHLTQALGFDPWGSFGVAYRSSTFEVLNPKDPDGARVSQKYQGIDIARIAFGGDFYPTPWLGFGPFIEMALGTNFRWPTALQALPPDVPNSPRAYALFTIGARVAFDPMRKAVAASARAATLSAPRPSGF